MRQMRRIATGVSALGSLWFLATAIAAQIVHAHDIAATPISAYLTGPASGWLQAAYYVLAVALVLLGTDMLPRRPRPHLAAGVLFLAAGCAVVLVAYTYSPWPLPDNPAHGTRVAIHIASAFAAFLTVTIAMFLATPLVWKGWAQAAYFALTGMVFALELAAAFAPAHALGAYGALEKLAIAGIVLWLIGAASAYALRGASRR